MIVRLASGEDSAAIAGIYAHYVAATPVSFETDPPDAVEMRARIDSGGDLYPWLVAEVGGAVAGFASASRFRPRLAYRFTVETSVYLAQDRHGLGLGRRLYERLIALVDAQGFAQAIAAITLPNEASVRLHEALGFAPAGTYRQVGWKCGGWHDVGLWQRALAPPADPPAEPRPAAGAWVELSRLG